jgi:hypothetical protein
MVEVDQAPRVDLCVSLFVRFFSPVLQSIVAVFSQPGSGI